MSEEVKKFKRKSVEKKAEEDVDLVSADQKVDVAVGDESIEHLKDKLVAIAADRDSAIKKATEFEKELAQAYDKINELEKSTPSVNLNDFTFEQIIEVAIAKATKDKTAICLEKCREVFIRLRTDSFSEGSLKSMLEPFLKEQIEGKLKAASLIEKIG